MGHVAWLRTSYWVGAVADAAAGISILIPSRMGEAEFRYPMGLAAALMFGWTTLLIWADRKPVERKGVLLLTVFPIITGLMVTAIYSAAVGRMPPSKMTLACVIEATLITLFLYSYLKARRVATRDKSRTS